MLDAKTKRFLRDIHRWAGLMVVAFVVFYCFTGILLNHRKVFNYFIVKNKTTYTIQPRDIQPLKEFIEFYKTQIQRKDDPRVIRIRQGGTIEFLYGTHGKTTYVIDPQKGSMTRIEKTPMQPWNWLNRLHKAFRTSSWWIYTTDAVSVLLIVVTLTGLVIFRFKMIEKVLLLSGLLVFALAVLLA